MLRWLYPITCEMCGEAAEHSICPECLASLERLPRPICLYCGSPLSRTPEVHDCCERCQGHPRTFSFARSALVQTEQNMQLIHLLKYRRAAYLADGLAPLLEEVWRDSTQLRDFGAGALVPVPVTRRQLSRRGYNQAAELARFLSKRLRLPVLHALERRETPRGTQTRLGARSRLLNALSAFHTTTSFTKGRRSLPERVILIDDVYTTGSTARACCKALLELPSVKEVAVLTLMRAGRPGN